MGLSAASTADERGAFLDEFRSVETFADEGLAEQDEQAATIMVADAGHEADALIARRFVFNLHGDRLAEFDVALAVEEDQLGATAIDATVPTKEEQERFLSLFSPMADRIYIEHLVVMQQQMEDLKGVVDGSKNFYGEELDLDRKVCAQSFYFLQIGCEGHTFPCPVPGLGKGLSMGNAKEQSLVEIWNGPKRRAFLRMLLQKRKDEVPECRGCTCFNAINNPAEDLDADAERLLPLFS